MKNWFPFTDYDFYAYLTAGLTVLFSVDFAVNQGAIMLRDTWPVVQIIFAIAIAYIIGQIIAGIAAVVLEHWLARRVLQPPVTVLLALEKPRRRECLVGRWIVGRYYEALPQGTRQNILSHAAEAIGTTPEAIRDPEEVFQVAFPVARSVADTSTRLEDFRKLYGFSRNMALAGLIAVGALVYCAVKTGEFTIYVWAGFVALGAVLLFGRFLKFYAAYGAEVLRTYSHAMSQKKKS